jgi:F-type H+-transporting ATPase subunit delta
MAELATIARPYAEALFKAVADQGANAREVADQVGALAQVAGNPQVRAFADNPKVADQQVHDLIVGSLHPLQLSPLALNLLRTLIENNRLAAVREIATQYRALVNQSTGISDATIFSAFPIEPAQISDVVASLEKRFGRKLNATVVLEPALIGGIRAVVGDEVFDTSVKARLEQMKVALTA